EFGPVFVISFAENKANGVSHEVLRHTGREVVVVGKDLRKLLRTVKREFFALQGKYTACVDFTTTLMGAVAPNCIKVLQAKPDRVHGCMTVRTLGVGYMALQTFTQRLVFYRAGVWQALDSGGWRRNLSAQHMLEHKVTALHRRGT